MVTAENSKKLNKKDMQETKGGTDVAGARGGRGCKADPDAKLTFTIDSQIGADDLKSDGNDLNMQAENRQYT